MEFEKRKAAAMAALVAPAPDKSPKGAVDAPIVPLLDTINRHPSYFTTSSCSGRISILAHGCRSSPVAESVEGDKKKAYSKKKAGGGTWIFVSHDPADPGAVVDLLFGAREKDVEGNLVFRFEPFIVAVECRDVPAAQALVSTAISCGFRESGITNTQKRVIIAIRCSIRLEVPLGRLNHILVPADYIHYLVNIANDKMEANRKRTESFLHVLQHKGLQASTKQIFDYMQEDYIQAADESTSLDTEAKGNDSSTTILKVNKAVKSHQDDGDRSISQSSEYFEEKGTYAYCNKLLEEPEFSSSKMMVEIETEPSLDGLKHSTVSTID